MPTGHQEEVSRKEKESSWITEGRGLGCVDQVGKVWLGTKNYQWNLAKIIGIRWVGCCGNSEKKEDLWCSKDHPDSGAVLVGMREGIPNRINKT